MKKKIIEFTAADNTTHTINCATDQVSLYRVTGTPTLTTGDYVIQVDGSETKETELVILWEAVITPGVFAAELLGTSLTAYQMQNDGLFHCIYDGAAWGILWRPALVPYELLDPNIPSPTGGLQLVADGIALLPDPTGDATHAPVLATDANGTSVKIDGTNLDVDADGNLNRGINTKWLSIDSSDYNATPASTSTITMNTDLTATVFAGMAVRYKIGGIYYYGIITAMAAGLLTLRGAPLNTIQELAFSPDPQTVHKELYILPASWNTTSNQLLEDEGFILGGDAWMHAPAKCVGFDTIMASADSSADPWVNLRVGATGTDYISTSNSNKGLVTNEHGKAATVVDIEPTKYSVVYGTAVELKCDDNTGAHDGGALAVWGYFVFV